MNDTTRARERLSADLAKVMEDIDALVNATAAHADGEATALRDRIRDRLGAATDALSSAQPSCAPGTPPSSPTPTLAIIPGRW